MRDSSTQVAAGYPNDEMMSIDEADFIRNSVAADHTITMSYALPNMMSNLHQQ